MITYRFDLLIHASEREGNWPLKIGPRGVVSFVTYLRVVSATLLAFEAAVGSSLVLMFLRPSLFTFHRKFCTSNPPPRAPT